MARAVFGVLTADSDNALALSEGALSALKEELAGYFGSRELIPACISLALLVNFFRQQNYERAAAMLFSVIVSAEPELRQLSVGLAQMLTAQGLDDAERQYQKMSRDEQPNSVGPGQAMRPASASFGVGIKRK